MLVRHGLPEADRGFTGGGEHNRGNPAPWRTDSAKSETHGNYCGFCAVGEIDTAGNSAIINGGEGIWWMGFLLKIGRQTALVESLQSASDEWCKYRDFHELGASESPSVWLFRDGEKLARISYNGRIWDLNGKEIVPPMGKYQKGDHVKIEVVNERTGENEWMWLSVDHCDDQRQLVFGTLDSEPLVNTDMRLGQELAVSYIKIRDHRRFN